MAAGIENHHADGGFFESIAETVFALAQGRFRLPDRRNVEDNSRSAAPLHHQPVQSSIRPDHTEFGVERRFLACRLFKDFHEPRVIVSVYQTSTCVAAKVRRL